jgi:hypothetical protein
MKLRQWCGAVLVLGAASLLLGACQKKETPGPAEAVGKSIDQAVSSVNEQAKAAADKAQDQLKDSGSDVGKKIDGTVEDAKAGAKGLMQKAGETLESTGKKIQDAGKGGDK